MSTDHSSVQHSPRDQVLAAIGHLDHVLPGQAPIHDFVHHNTLHGFQHLPFEQALAEFTALTGIDCYLPDQQFRAFYQQGRINDDDLDAALRQQFGDTLTAPLAKLGERTVTACELYRIALLHDLQPLTPGLWSWRQTELANGPQAVLWQSVLDKLGVATPALHPEDLLDLSGEQADSWLSATDSTARQQLRQRAFDELAELFAAVGECLTLRGLLLALTGRDVLDTVRPQLIRLCASLLDEGQAAWRLPQREELGLYRSWRQGLRYDAQAFFQEFDAWPSLIEDLPDDAVDAIVCNLTALAIPEQRWSGYLQRLALELPGWSGLINWRQTRPGYRGDDATQPQLADYLAIRLVLDRACLQKLCRETWQCDARFDKLKKFFGRRPAEFFVRHALYRGCLPEYLTDAAQSLTVDAVHDLAAWQAVAERIWTWQCSPLARAGDSELSAYRHGWQLFTVCRALQLTDAALADLNQTQMLEWLRLLAGFSQQQRGYVWLTAYEHHYRQALLQAIHANHDRGRWARRDDRPSAQIVFCMDDREEGIRRHLEELNPQVETLGAAGFFGVPMNYRGLDDEKLTPLCPVVVVPSHDVHEQAETDQAHRVSRHRQGRRFQHILADWLFHGLRRETLLAYPLINAAAPVTLVGLLVKSLFPKSQQRLLAGASSLVAPDVDTCLQFTAESATPASPEQPRLGFTDGEQADRVAGFLRNTGLTYGFAELVVLMGHGSISQNNPHLAAYDCGACSGRHGGPNARLFAAMANRPAVRALLAERGIVVPEDTWFVGAEHNTCDEAILWFDRDQVPSARRQALDAFAEQLAHAQRMSAHERCRRLASAPRNPQPQQALRHFLERAADFSQARPELGHATNAAALVGRRSLTQGAFFDRRLFLISYDPTQDPDGTVLEGILLAVGPVGAGINLEYYFSTVNNERLGCGSKVPHNLTGFFAVMEGAASDLRTGLPRQMIEIHEAMRLQIVVEAKTTVLEQIYARQPSLQELIAGGWVHLIAKDPDDGRIFLFERGVGFVLWQPVEVELPLRDNSPDCYRQETQPVAPMLIRQPVMEDKVN